MQVKPDRATLYRPEAMEFQRRRLAGEVRVMPERRLLLASAVVMVVFALLFVVGWVWAIPVEYSPPCSVIEERHGRTVVAVYLPRGNPQVQSARLINPVRADIAVEDIRFLSTSQGADASCELEATMSIWPVRQAIVRMLRR